MQGLRECAEQIHARGVIATIELCHCGATKIGSPGSPVYGPSSFVRESDGVHVHGMTEAEIAETVADFASAAKAVYDCGFDGVCIHAGHEWLPHQFMSLRTNRRTDRYGGSVENRARFLTEVFDAVRAACGEDFVIECRLSGSENAPDPGYTLDEMCRMCAIYARHCDVIQVSAGRYYDPVDTLMISSTFQPHGCNLGPAEAIRRCVDIPVAVVGGINDPDLCEDIVASGKADLVVMCRQRLADPMFVRKCMEGRADEIRPCIRCMRCFPGPIEHVLAEQTADAPNNGDPLARIFAQLGSCTVNPRYKADFPVPAPPPGPAKRVLVIGGGCAGMQAAITAAERGHRVTLIEKSDRLGGTLNFAEHDKVKYDLFRLARAMEAELRRLAADVRLNTSLTRELADELRPDTVIEAVGASVTGKGIPGMDGPNVLSAADCYTPGMTFGSHAVVIGGGQTGCETAEHIGRTGTAVTLVVKYDRLCPDAYRLHGIKLRALLTRQGCAVLYDTVCTGVESNGASVRNRNTGETAFLRADCIVNAVGLTAPAPGVTEALCPGVPVTRIGDCVRARTIAEAVEEGYQAALRL